MIPPKTSTVGASSALGEGMAVPAETWEERGVVKYE